LIEVKNLVKKYGNHTAVDNLSFTVKDEQVYGFLGPNGAGKSTTMNIIIGYLSATEGEVIINGHDIFEEPEEAKKCIGYLPELPPLYMDMTVKEYLQFVAELKKVPKKERAEQIEKAMQMTNITDMQKRLIKHLSKGYKQRVGLAQAIIGFPEIIILDEPTVGLDPKQIIEIRDLIKKLSKEHTIILSSHIMQEISAVCDHILIINKGQLVAEGTPEELAEMTQGTQEVTLRVKAQKATVETILNSVKDIHRKEYLEPVEENTTEVVVYAQKQKDIRVDLFKAFAAQKAPILSMSSYSKSLEDIFLEVTEDHANKKYLAKEEKQTDKIKETEEKEEKQEESEE
jgi:ABC-2 type transport system ATP-binding protein